MPHIKQAIWNRIESKLKRELQSLEYLKENNKRSINELAEEQKIIKKQIHAMHQLLKDVSHRGR